MNILKGMNLQLLVLGVVVLAYGLDRLAEHLDAEGKYVKCEGDDMGARRRCDMHAAGAFMCVVVGGLVSVQASGLGAQVMKLFLILN